MRVFKIGDRVVYPMHGAGVIEAVEEREVLGEVQTYYIMHIPYGDMKVMIPTKSVEEVGLRGVITAEVVSDVVLHLKAEEEEEAIQNWNRRYRANLEKMRSGDIYAVAEVVRSLVHRDREKGLSTGERKMLDNARKILLSEIVLARGLDVGEAQELLEEALA